MNTFDKQIKIKMILETQQALQNIESLRQAASKMGTGNTGQVSNVMENLRGNTEKTKSCFENLQSTMKSHLLFGASSLLLGGMIGIPAAIADIAKETESLTTKLRQNLELTDKYHNNSSLLESDMKRLTDIAGIYATGYGESLPKVLDSMQLLARRFKDVEQVSYLESAALTMAKLDNVDLMTATQNLESVMLQFQLDIDGTRKFLNSFTVAVHTSKITGTELLEALQRSGSSFKQFNMGIDESIAAVAALATESGRSGSTIGNSFKSIAANFSMEKAIKALDAYNVKLYEVNENGTKSMRKGVNVFQELQKLFSQLDAEGQEKLALAISGGKYQVNQMLNFLGDANQTFSNILNEIQTKSSDQLTAQLLKMGLDTFQVKLMQLEASLQVFGKTIGDEVLPNLKNMVDGLTNGIMWLTQNKEAVARTTSALIELGKAVMAYVVSQRIASAAIAEGTTLLRIMYMLEGDFTTAFAGMGASLKAFGMTAAAVTLQMAALYAAVNVIQAMYDRFSDKTGLTGQQQDLTEQLQYNEYGRQQALANVSRTGVSEDEVNRIYGERKQELQDKLDAVNNAKKEQENVATNNALEESERAFQAIVDRAMASAKVNVPTVSNLIPEGHTSHSTGAGSKTAPDKTDELIKLDKYREVDHLLKMAAIDTDTYNSKLESINTQQQLFGTTSENSAEKIKLMNSRIGEMLGNAMEFSEMARDYEQQSNDIIAANSNLVEALNKRKLSWADLSKDEKREFAEQYKEYINDYQLLAKLLELSDKLKVSAADASKNAGKIGADSIQTAVTDRNNLYARNTSMINLSQQKETLGLGRYSTDEQKQAIELKYSLQQLEVEQKRLNELQQGPHTKEQLLQQEVVIEQLKAKVVQLGDKWKTVREQMAGIVNDLLLGGKSVHDVWKSLVKDLARESLQRIFKVEDTQTSFLGSLLSGLSGHAEGGIFNEEHLAVINENNKKEAVIPLEANKDRGKQLWLQSGHELGMFGQQKNQGVVPVLKNPNIAKEVANVSNAKISNARLETLTAEQIAQSEKVNTLMEQQNQMLQHMINNQGNSGTVQPVIVNQTMSQDQLYKMITKMRSNGYRV